MPIGQDIRVTPVTDIGAGVASQPLIDDGVYNAKIVDIVHIPAEQNKLYGTAQLKLRFKITDGPYKDVELTSWVSLTMNPGWENGSASNLYTIAKAVFRREPDLSVDFYPSSLMGGMLRIFVKTTTSKKGKTFSKVSEYMAPSLVSAIPSQEKTDDAPLPEEPAEEFDVDKIPF